LPDAGSGQSLGTPSNFIVHLLAIAPLTKTLALDDAEVDEDILALIIHDEAVAFFAVKPLY